MLNEGEQWRVIEGDCLEVLKSLPDGCVDAVVTDPPYGVGLDYGTVDDTRDNLAHLVAGAMPELRRVAKRVVLTPGNGNQSLYPPPTWTLAWIDPAGSGRCTWGYQCWHPILVYGGCPFMARGLGARPDIYMPNGTIVNEGYRRVELGHPCPKPEPFMRWLVNRTTFTGDLVLDPFCGSGTTGVACIQTGRRFIGIEIEPKYAAIARRRIADAAPLFVRSPEPDPMLIETLKEPKPC